MMVAKEENYSHEDFVDTAVHAALKAQEARTPWYCVSHDAQGYFSTRAAVTVAKGRPLFGHSSQAVSVVGRALYKLGEDDARVGCVISRGDGITAFVAIRHSCEPNMRFVHSSTITFEAARDINCGEELTVDYATLRDQSMPAFACSCGTASCRSVVFSDAVTERQSTQRRSVGACEDVDPGIPRLLGPVQPYVAPAGPQEVKVQRSHPLPLRRKENRKSVDMSHGHDGTVLSSPLTDVTVQHGTRGNSVAKKVAGDRAGAPSESLATASVSESSISKQKKEAVVSSAN